MSTSIRVYTKKARAAQTGQMIGVRLQPDMVEKLDLWIAAQKPAVSRPEAIRAILNKHLTEA